MSNMLEEKPLKHISVRKLFHFIAVRSLTPQRATGNALALLNFPQGTLFNRASWHIFKSKKAV